MKLKLRLSEREVLVYREKWGVIAYGAALGCACLVFALGFYFVSNQPRTPKAFLVFSLLFGLVGAALLLRLPAMAKKTIDESGAHVFSADSWGISVTANLGARRQSVLWTSIEELVLVKNFKTIELGETTYVGRAVLVFLLKDEYDSWSVSDRINAGASRSGSGRPYLHVPFPSNQEDPLAEALRQCVPARVNVRTEKLAVFDYKKSADSYPNA
ncbi:MAG: hypothetical protein KBE07_11590 [Rhodoferax sp.]|nr:hypothetical protein [Rhodoferax sp.]MBP9685282.1 hypothetical protein [Rhodoferax sp.]